MDDPISALDSLMSAHVFEECVHGTLQRQNRTRVIVTNVVEPAVLRYEQMLSALYIYMPAFDRSLSGLYIHAGV